MLLKKEKNVPGKWWRTNQMKPNVSVTKINTFTKCTPRILDGKNKVLNKKLKKKGSMPGEILRTKNWDFWGNEIDSYDSFDLSKTLAYYFRSRSKLKGDYKPNLVNMPLWLWALRSGSVSNTICGFYGQIQRKEVSIALDPPAESVCSLTLVLRRDWHPWHESPNQKSIEGQRVCAE